MNYPFAFYHRAPGVFFFRILGWGLWFASYALQPPLFSERNGHVRVLRLGGWRVMVLRPEGRS